MTGLLSISPQLMCLSIDLHTRLSTIRTYLPALHLHKLLSTRSSSMYHHHHLLRRIAAASCKAGVASGGAKQSRRMDGKTVAAGMASVHSEGCLLVAPFQGQKLRTEHAFSKDELAAYSKLCGDGNPIHTQEEAAKCAGFDCCVVHGMLQAALFPALIGSRFPGARLAFETFNFRAPVFVGERVQVEVEVLKIDNEHDSLRIEFNTICHKNENILVIEGSAIAIVPLQKCN